MCESKKSYEKECSLCEFSLPSREQERLKENPDPNFLRRLFKSVEVLGERKWVCANCNAVLVRSLGGRNEVNYLKLKDHYKRL